MRQTLFVISFDATIPLGPLGDLPVFGVGLLLALWVMFGVALLYANYRETGSFVPSLNGGGMWAGFALAITIAPIQQVLTGFPIFGYGSMLFLAFVVSTVFASRRAVREGFSENAVWDLTFWLFVSGIFGARIWFVIQYRELFFGPGKSPWGILNLPDGGLVFYGGLIGSTIASIVFCRVRKIELLKFADVVMPAVFIGLMFGRLGCLLNGCCWGDICDLPWAVTFPPESAVFPAEVARGVIFKDAASTLPLHPTQIYSSLNALVLAILTWAYYPFRHKDGAVIAVGWLTYPISRFTIEFLRNDLGGYLGTPFTPAQLFSFGLFATGCVFLWYVSRQPDRQRSQPQAPQQPQATQKIPATPHVA